MRIKQEQPAQRNVEIESTAREELLLQIESSAKNRRRERESEGEREGERKIEIERE